MRRVTARRVPRAQQMSSDSWRKESKSGSWVCAKNVPVDHEQGGGSPLQSDVRNPRTVSIRAARSPGQPHVKERRQEGGGHG